MSTEPRLDRLARYQERLDRASPVGGITRDLIDPLLGGRLEYRELWEDLRAPATGINPPGQVSDPAIQDDGTLLFSPSAVNLIAVLFQMPHSWKAGSNVRVHAHWMKSSDAAGDVIWEYRYRVLELGAVAPAWSAWIPRVTRSADPGSTQIQVIDAFGEIDMEGCAVSTMLSLQFHRLATDPSDDYGAGAALLEIDVHYQVDGFGSEQEYTKETLNP